MIPADLREARKALGLTQHKVSRIEPGGKRVPEHRQVAKTRAETLERNERSSPALFRAIDQLRPHYLALSAKDRCAFEALLLARLRGVW